MTQPKNPVGRPPIDPYVKVKYRAFGLRQSDEDRLMRLVEMTGKSRSAVVRAALREMEKKNSRPRMDKYQRAGLRPKAG